jgi:predicted transcriptional regulator
MVEINSQKIKQLREEKGISVAALAKKAGISWATITRAEQSERTTEKTVKKIAEALGQDIHALIKGGLQKEGESADKYNEVLQGEVAQKAQKIGPTSFFEIDTGTNRFGQAVSDLREIFNSGDSTIITAILANLFTFKRAALREQEIAALKSENQVLQREMESLKSRLAAVEEKLKGG